MEFPTSGDETDSGRLTRIIIQIADDKDFFLVRHDEILHVGMPPFIGGERRSKNRIGVRGTPHGTASPLTMMNVPAERIGLHVF